MKSVLIVDDDPVFLDRLVQAFRAQQDQFKVLSAGNGAEARKIISSEPIDMLVTDLEMPVMDGYELLAFMLDNHPSVAMIVMSEFETDSLGEALGDIESMQCLQKPISPESLLYRARAAFTRRAKGFVTGISLSGFLQLLHIEKQTCGLRLSFSGRVGTLEILDGEIINAVCEGQEGEGAVYEILSWDHPDIEMISSVLAGHRAIGASLPHLLFEAARQKDETARLKQPITPPKVLPRPPGLASKHVPQIYLSRDQLAAINAAFSDILEVQGILGVALVDMKSAFCLVSETGSLTPNFNRLASSVAEVARTRIELLEDPDSEDRVEGVTVHLSQHVELYHPLTNFPDLMLYLVAERNRTDLAQALTQLMEIEETIGSLELTGS